VGTALLVDPSVHVEIAQGIMRYLKEKGFASPDELRGRVRVRDAENGSA
jgi:dihydroorotate dehydrogenase